MLALRRLAWVTLKLHGWVGKDRPLLGPNCGARGKRRDAEHNETTG
jgi:hypothetical protein